MICICFKMKNYCEKIISIRQKMKYGFAPSTVHVRCAKNSDICVSVSNPEIRLERPETHQRFLEKLRYAILHGKITKSKN